jgi:hypothetical protein
MLQTIAEKKGWIDGCHRLRDEALAALSDADLGFSLGGSTLSLGALCREMGEVQMSYTRSFVDFRQDFSDRAPDSAVTASVAALRAWFTDLDAAMQQAFEALAEADLARMIDRGFPVTPVVQMDIYVQAVLIFLGKASVYLRAMGRPLSENFIAWIG